MIDIKYAAGLFDGEGYVYIFKKERGAHVGYYLSAGITMTHRPTLEGFCQQFGGHLNGNLTDINPKHRPLFHWGLANKLAADFLSQIRPYTRIKQAEIDIGLELQRHIDETGYPTKEQREEVRTYREDLFQRCKALKKVGYERMLKKYSDGRFGTPVRKLIV